MITRRTADFLYFMKTKILLPCILVLGLVGFLSLRYVRADDATPTGRRALIVQSVLKTLASGHFQPQQLNDSFSARIYDRMLESLDFGKNFFTAAEISELRKYRYRIDDQLKASSLDFYYKLDDLFTRNLTRAEGYYKDILAQPFTFNGNEQIQLDGEKLPYASNEAALRDRWRLFLKHRTLTKYVELKDAQAKDTTSAAKKTDVALETEARAAVQKNQEYFFRRWKKVDSMQRFSIFVNAIANSEDPHTDYLAPADKQRFDEAMSGSFSGIGAQLKDEDGKCIVAAIITGAPAWKQGELKAGDHIMKVAQGGAEPEDIQGFEIDDVVKRIRGKKGSEVRLTVKKVDGAVKVIPITRGEVLLEETFARSAMITSPAGPIGYIFLPEFYANFNQSSGRRSSEDVAIEVKKVKEAGAVGVVLDLRNNGGGSLSDVVDIAGLFIDGGPVVQVKSSDADPMTLRDGARGVLWDGPLAVMVNSGSASASEIMAAAMQDYGRAVIIGSPTFGKGTVQKIVSLDDALDAVTRMRMLANADNEGTGPGSLGNVKLTMQKFYRINGGSTQLRGVTPDIVLPDPYKYIEMGERRADYAMPWDQIPAANYRRSSPAVPVGMLVSRSRARVGANASFTLIEETAKRLKAQEDRVISLNEAAYRKENEAATAASKRAEELEKKGTPLTTTALAADLPQINRDSSTMARNTEWLKTLSKDIYLAETIAVLTDLAKEGKMSLANPE